MLEVLSWNHQRNCWIQTNHPECSTSFGVVVRSTFFETFSFQNSRSELQLGLLEFEWRIFLDLASWVWSAFPWVLEQTLPRLRDQSRRLSAFLSELHCPIAPYSEIELSSFFVVPRLSVLRLPLLPKNLPDCQCQFFQDRICRHHHLHHSLPVYRIPNCWKQKIINFYFLTHNFVWSFYLYIVHCL